MVSDAEGAAVLDAGAVANLVCFVWLCSHNRILEREGYQKASTREIPIWRWPPG